jgi:hypothetical protein
METILRIERREMKAWKERRARKVGTMVPTWQSFWWTVEILMIPLDEAFYTKALD